MQLSVIGRYISRHRIFCYEISGILLMMLSLILIAIIYISMSQNIVTKYNEITMITIATYTFTKITTAIVKAVKQKEVIRHF